jgi:hypothetical protein
VCFGHGLRGCALVAVLIACGGDEEPRPESRAFPDSLVGVWVRVYPAAGGRDTLTLRDDGSASGLVSAVSAEPLEAILRWQVGSPWYYDPTTLCFRDARVFSCTAFQLRGDTLALADRRQTVFLRAGAEGLDVRARDSLGPDPRSRWGDTAPTARPPGARGP